MPRLRPITLFSLACAFALPALADDPSPEQRFLSDSHLKQNIIATAAKSTVLTGGFGNSAVAIAELGGALLVSLLALAAPLAAFAIVVLILWLAIRLIRHLRRTADRTEPAK